MLPRYPVDSISLASGYGVRVVRGASQGHWGYDLAGKAGDAVKAPEVMTVTRRWTDDTTPPFVGYGPGGIEALGDSGVYHLLAHLDPSTIAVDVGEPVMEGEIVGRMPSHVGAAGPHVHWEVRKREVDSPSTRAGNTLVPASWVTFANNGWHASDSGPQPQGAGSSNGILWLALVLLAWRYL